jgi:hypothetical protein
MTDTIVNKPLPYTLRAIYLRSSTSRLGDGFDPTILSQELSAALRTGNGQVDCKETAVDSSGVTNLIRSCIFTSRFEFAYLTGKAVQTDEEFEKSLVAQITADIAVDYIFNGDIFPGPDELQHWGQVNVLIHAWPYWREFCHNMLLRMGLPITLIPMIQFSDKKNPPSSSLE